MQEQEVIYNFNEIVIIKYTPVWCYIVSNNSEVLLKYIYDTLIYQPDGFFFAPQYQDGKWDGINHLFKPATKKFRVGLIYRVIELLSSVGCQVQVLGFSFPLVSKLKTNTYKNAKGEDVTLRFYQEEAVLTSLNKRIGILKAPPRSGKTLISVAIIDNENTSPVIFFVRSKDLAYQTLEVYKQNFEGKSIGFVCDGICEIGEINIITMQSAFYAYNKKYKEKGLYIEKDLSIQNKEDIRNLVRDAKVIFTDECFPKGTLIHIDENTQVSIESLYKDTSITHVLSYNEITQKLEQKRILRRFKKRVNQNQLFKIDVIRNNKRYSIRCTDNHKFWTSNRGMVEAKKLSCDDILKTIPKGNIMYYRSKTSYICPDCGKICKSLAGLSSHFYPVHTEEGRKKKKDIVDKVNWEKMVKKRKERGVWHKSLKEMGERRKGENNPINRYPNTREKIRKKCKEYFSNLPREKQLEQIVRFKNAPKFKGKMTVPEKIINDFKIVGLKYTGNGFYNKENFFTVPLILDGKKKEKIPDFTCFSEKKVIEVMDFEYWHNKKEITPLTEAYLIQGYTCLILDAAEVVKNPEQIKLDIYKFLYNHDVHPVSLCYYKNGAQCKEEEIDVYDIEVEENHNYFANGILVSNCHHLVSPTSGFLYDKTLNAIMKIGLSATPFSASEDSILVEERTGKIIYEVTYSALIKEGYLMKPYIYMYKLPKIVDDSGPYPSVYNKAIVNNDFLSNLVKGLVNTLNKAGKSVVVQTDFISHTKDIAKRISCEYLTGQDKTEKRKRILQDLLDKKILCVVSTLFEEGLDTSTLDYTINLAGGLSNISTFQRMRSITAHESKTTIGIIDFIHQCKYLKKHSKKRMDLYLSEPEFVVEVRDVSKKTISEIFS